MKGDNMNGDHKKRRWNGPDLHVARSTAVKKSAIKKALGLLVLAMAGVLLLSPAAALAKYYYSCPSQEASCEGFGPNECFESNGWVVQIDNTNGFPRVEIQEGKIVTTFAYRIIPKNPPKGKKIKDIDLLTPVLDPMLMPVGSSPKGLIIDFDPKGGFGAGLPDDDVFQWRYFNECGGTIYVTFAGELTTEARPMVLKFDRRAIYDERWPNGLILAPAGVGTRPMVKESAFLLEDVEGATCSVTLTEPPNIQVIIEGSCEYAIVNKQDLTINGAQVIEFPDRVWAGTESSPRTYTYCYPNGQCVNITFP
jgi:hypothetical protein